MDSELLMKSQKLSQKHYRDKFYEKNRVNTVVKNSKLN
jgi:hypothetical protein